MTDPNATRLLNTFKGVDITEHGSKWDSLYRESYTPWDRGTASLALNDVLEDKRDHLIDGKKLFGSSASSSSGSGRKKALVPACGRGYDVQLLSAFGYDVVGLDISEKALEQAKKVAKEIEAGDDDTYELSEGVAEQGKITWVKGDFFKDDFLAKAQVEKFDLIFDYTFFCAIPPSTRPEWAKRMSNLLAEDGTLVCLEFPTRKLLSTGGPPYAAASEFYLAHLMHPGKKCVDYDHGGRILWSEISEEPEAALKRLAYLTPTRTHKSGEDDQGNVHDRVSVWGHRGSWGEPPRPVTLRDLQAAG